MTKAQLKQIRLNMGLSQTELAHKLGLAHRTSIIYMEGGRNKIMAYVDIILKEELAKL